MVRIKLHQSVAGIVSIKLQLVSYKVVHNISLKQFAHKIQFLVNFWMTILLHIFSKFFSMSNSSFKEGLHQSHRELTPFESGRIIDWYDCGRNPRLNIRKKGARYKERRVTPTMKFGKGPVMVWGCF